MEYINRFQNAKYLSVSVRNSYSGYQLMHIFLDNFHTGKKYTANIERHQAELRREEKFTDQESLSISSLQTDYLSIKISSGYARNNERDNLVQTKCTFCGGTNHSAEKIFKYIRKYKEKFLMAGK